MTVPAFDLGLVLPPFIGSRPGMMAFQSPYSATSADIVQRFGTTPERNTLLRGFLDLRAALRDIGVTSGFQWVDGSFVEDKERRLQVPPGDIDIVTVFERPLAATTPADWNRLAAPLQNTLFDPGYCKATYNCEAFYIDLGRTGQSIASQSAFWFGLFSHQRDTFRWKGIVRCPLGSAGVDDEASDELHRRGF